MKTAYQRYHAATTELRAKADYEWRRPPTDVCACCQRPWHEVEDPELAAAYRYDTYTAQQWLCTTCYTPKLGSYDFLGVERMAGKSGKTVAGKLGMLPGSGGVITADDKLYLAFPPKNMEKYRNGWLGRNDRLFQGKPLNLLMRLYSDGRLGPIDQGFIYFTDFGRKADVVMANLALTSDLRELWCNSHAGTEALDLQALMDLCAVIREHELVDKASSKALWRPIQNAASGRVDLNSIEAWAQSTPGAQELVANLPVDPHDRIRMHLMLPALLEATQ